MTRRWGIALLVVALTATAAYALASGLGSDGDAGAAAGPGSLEVDADALVAQRLAAPLLVRTIDERAPLGDGRLVELSSKGDARQVGQLACKRVHAVAGGPGLCLGLDETGVDYDGVVFDDRYRERRRFPIDGIPDRARVSPDGRYGAYTSFDERGAVGYFAGTSKFTTYTRVVDMRTGKPVLRLEDLRLSLRGQPLDSSSANLWGVTFAGGGRFYATAALTGVYYLIEGELGSARARVVRERVECPALSPDGTRIAYKRRIGDDNRWRYHVLDLASGRDVALAERRSVDDQPEWLDDDTIVYSDDRDLFAVPADGGGRPVRLAAGATSPAALGAGGGS